MNAIAQFLLTVFGGLFAWIAKKWGAGLALKLTAATALLAATVALFSAVQAVVQISIAQIDNEYLLMGFYALWPANASTCIAFCIGVDLAAFIFSYKAELIRMVSN